MGRHVRYGRSVGALVGLAVLLVAACATPTNGAWAATTPLTQGSTFPVTKVEAMDCASAPAGSATPTTRGCVALPKFRETGPNAPVNGLAWDGQVWRVIPHPGLNLHALSCAEPDWCVASNNPDPLGADPHRLWRWDGRTWTRIAGAGTMITELDCPRRDSCVALGGSRAHRFDGTRWTDISTNRTSAHNLDSVTCSAPTSCLFATQQRGADHVFYIERWNGSTWSTVDTGGVLDIPGKIECPLADRCYYAGTRADGAGYKVVLEQWDGVRWTKIPIALPDTVYSFHCASDGSCLGKMYDDTLVLDRGGWRVVHQKPPSGMASGCAGADACFTFPSTSAPAGTPPLVRWDGTSWVSGTAPGGPGVSRTALALVSCPTESSCLAGGYYLHDGARVPTVQRYDNGTWTAAPPLPGLGGRTVELTGLSCVALPHCLAVGSWTSGSTSGPYVARWNGSGWADESPAAAGAQPGSRLRAVSCTSTGCVAAGYPGTSTGADSVAMRSTGAGQWTAMPGPTISPAMASQTPEALQISCASLTFCAVSTIVANSTVIGMLTTWNGTSWSAPYRSAMGTDVFVDVACPTATKCIAVGGAVGATANAGRVATWNGSSWRTATVDKILRRVSCSAGDRCVALAAANIFGLSADALKNTRVLVGTTWHSVRPPTPPVATDDDLAELSCTGRSCLAVGSTGTSPLGFRWTS